MASQKISSLERLNPHRPLIRFLGRVHDLEDEAKRYLKKPLSQSDLDAIFMNMIRMRFGLEPINRKRRNQ